MTYFSRDNADPKLAEQLWSEQTKKFRQTRRNAERVQKLLRGELRAALPRNFTIAGSENVRVDFPQKYTTSLHLQAVIESKRPRIKRNPVGTSSRAARVSTEIEQAVNTLLDARYPYERTCYLMLHEAIGGVAAVIDTADWTGVPDLLDKEGKVRDQYQRDKKGKRRMDYESDAEFEVDDGESAKAHEEDRLEYMAGRYPVKYRAYSVIEAVPIFGPDDELAGMVSCSEYRRSELLKRGYRWGSGLPLMQPGVPEGGSDGARGVLRGGDESGAKVKLYEVYFLEECDCDEGDHPQGHPCVAYCVDGMPTTRDGKGYQRYDRMTCINLFEEYGLTRLPVVWNWGAQWYATDPDARGIPYTMPFMRSWLTADQIATCIAASMFWVGFPVLIENMAKSDMQEPEDEAEEDRTEKVTTIEPMSIIQSEGQLSQLQVGRISPDIWQLEEMLLGANKEEGPPPAAFGGGAPDASGLSKSVSRRYVEDIMRPVIEAVRSTYEAVASLTVEIMECLAQKHGGVVLNVVTNAPTAQRGNQSPTRTRFEWTAGLAGTAWDVQAKFVRVPGENLALAQQFFGFWQGGGILTKEFREWAFGDENPEQFVVDSILEKALFSPEGQQSMLAEAAERLGDQKLAEQFQLRQKGQVSANGTPNGMLAGLMGGPDAASGLAVGAPPPVGMGTGGNPATAGLAGAVGGAMSADMAGVQAAGVGAGPMGPM